MSVIPIVKIDMEKLDKKIDTILETKRSKWPERHPVIFLSIVLDVILIFGFTLFGLLTFYTKPDLLDKFNLYFSTFILILWCSISIISGILLDHKFGDY